MPQFPQGVIHFLPTGLEILEGRGNIDCGHWPPVQGLLRIPFLFFSMTIHEGNSKDKGLTPRLIRGSLSPPRRDFTGVFRRAVTASKTPRKMGLQAPLLAPRLGSFLFLIIRFLLIKWTLFLFANNSPEFNAFGHLPPP